MKTERDRERQRETERDRERQRETERDRERQRETERDREMEKRSVHICNESTQILHIIICFWLPNNNKLAQILR